MQQSYQPVHYNTTEISDNDIVFMFDNKYIYLQKEDELLQFSDIKHLANEISFYCFAENGTQKMLIPSNADNAKLIKNTKLQPVEIRQLHFSLSESLQPLLILARHLYHWRQTYIYCPKCLHPLTDHSHERALICNSCQHINYPRISPSIIVAIRRGKEILLARAANFPEKRYGLIAGFVEAGETIEQAVHREVAEEVNLKIKNIQYIKSQPWPFPDSLMLGFTAEYASGEIIIAEDELEHAAWFKTDELPQLPPLSSIAWQLINLTIKNLI
jgi:NADH pyrophosphatase NudC (nudix superfamily)